MSTSLRLEVRVGIRRDPRFDETIALLREGYAFGARRCEALGTDVFRTRIALRDVVFVRGAEAAEVFYGGGRFTRAGAIPRSAKRLLQDEGSVQALDGAAHHHRKAMFLGLLWNEAAEEALAAGLRAAWVAAVPTWSRRERIVLLDEAHALLARVVCEWAGVPVEDPDRMAGDLVAMIDNAGRFGPPNWAATLRRRGTERRMRALLRRIRAGELVLPEGTAARTIALHRDESGRLLDLEAGAVELVNVLRPTVAVGRYLVFCALALHEHPAWRERLAAGDEAELAAFVQEVRRFYPFFPAVGGRVREAFAWRGERFEAGQWVLLDLYGTNRDPRSFEDPGAFRPERFLARPPTPYDLVPQGGGDVRVSHRCPGERVTLALMKEGVRRLLATRYTVPAQDLTVDLTRVPTQPESGFVLAGVG